MRKAPRIGALIERRRAVTTRDRTQALLQIATSAAANYRREKQERGLLDYDDLIDKTLAMLDRVSSGWVHYKLDRGVDHVLIDEAQDTSPRQWDIVAPYHLRIHFRRRRARWRRAHDLRGRRREAVDLFVPGRRASRIRSRAAGRLKKKFKDAGLKFDPVSFTYSFRSGPAILQSVDHVFREETIYRSIHSRRKRISDSQFARRCRARA